MSLFSRLRNNEDLSAFEKPQLIKSISLLGWGMNFTVHLIRHRQDLSIFSRFNENDWIELKPDSRGEADRLMEALLPKQITWQNPYDWQPAVNLGLMRAEDVQRFYIGNSRKFGFAAVSLDDISSAEVPLSEAPNTIFTLGRVLDEKILGGWLPTSNEESHVLLHYFNNVPLQVGFFGPFKRIIKNLTNAIEKDPLLAQNPYLLAALGFGFGRIEAKTTRPKQGLLENRSDYYQWDLASLLTLPGFNGNRYPSLATLQFLMRRGVRFMHRLSRLSPEMSEVFKHYVLLGAHAWHNAKKGDSEYLSRQQMVTQIIYSNSGLAIRDRESRKIILADISALDTHVSNTARALQGSKDESNILFVRQFVENFAAFTGSSTNSGIAHYVYHLCQAAEIEFPWSETLVSTMIRSTNPKVQSHVNQVLKENPTYFAALEIEALLSLLRSSDDELVNALQRVLIESLNSPSWYGTDEYRKKEKFWALLDRWSSSHASAIPSNRDLAFTKNLLLASWQFMYGHNKLRNRFFFQLLAGDALDMSAEWIELIANLTVEYSWPNKTENLLGFFGLVPSTEYEKGFLDYLTTKNWWLISPFAKSLSRCLNSIWLEENEMRDLVSTFMESGKPGSRELMMELSISETLYDQKVETIRAEVTRHDPTGSAFLGLLGEYLKTSSSKEIHQLLLFLSREEFGPFWRRNASELKVLFSSWKTLPEFIWKYSDTLPLNLVESLRNSDNFLPRFFESLTPKKIAQMTDRQRDLVVDVIGSATNLQLSDSILRALLTAPSAELNSVARDHIQSKGKMEDFWLLMLESKLPVSVVAATRFLESRMDHSDFVPKLLMALDSNDSIARKRALGLLGDTKNPALIKEVTSALLENRNVDTWQVVNRNLPLIDDVTRIQDFTRTVLLSRRQGRSIKEDLKVEIDRLFNQLEDAVEKRTIMRMSRSSVAADREWAMRKLALKQVTDPSVIIDEAWKS